MQNSRGERWGWYLKKGKIAWFSRQHKLFYQSDEAGYRDYVECASWGCILNRRKQSYFRVLENLGPKVMLHTLNNTDMETIAACTNNRIKFIVNQSEKLSALVVVTICSTSVFTLSPSRISLLLKPFSRFWGIRNLIALVLRQQY